MRGKQITAVVLAGGKGTRLHPITAAIPKPLVPVGEHPILDYVLTWLYRCHIKEVIFAIGHLAEIITAVVGDGKRWGLRVKYSIEEKPLGTIGPLRLIENLPDNFLVLNGDILTDMDLRRFYQFHLENNALLTIATVKRKHQVDFGVLNFSENNLTMTAFEEKPILEYSVSMGIYGMRKEVLEYIPKNRPMGLDGLVARLLKDKKTIKVYPYNGEWLDIGRLEDYILANSSTIKPLLKKILEK